MGTMVEIAQTWGWELEHEVDFHIPSAEVAMAHVAVAEGSPENMHLHIEHYSPLPTTTSSADKSHAFIWTLL